jgi:hypothetical protein
MSIPAPKVEIGFDLVGTDSPFLTLDNPTKGKLDDPAFPLSGTIFYDVTDRMVEISIGRGKNRQLDQYDVGLATVMLQNNDRIFDPTYTASPYFGQIIPKRALRISAGTAYSFVGVADDWNLQYEPNGQSIVSLAASDAFSYFTEQTTPAITNTEELTGARINSILDLPDVNWPTANRRVDPGIEIINDEPTTDSTNVLAYLKQITASEPGSFFIDRDGNVVFQDRHNTLRTTPTVIADDGTGIPYVGMNIQYGSELLYNEIVIGAPVGTAITQNIDSINEYGVLNFTQTGLLNSSLESVQSISEIYASRFSQPEYRFEFVEIQLDELPAAQQQEILALDISDIVKIIFTPNNIPPAIVRYGEITRIDHSVTVVSHTVRLGFASVERSPWTLSDDAFGRLSEGNVLYF